MKELIKTIKEVFKKRSPWFLIRYFPKAFYYAYLKKPKTFVFQKSNYNYFYHLYNYTYLNERTVEIPIVWKFVRQYQGKNILEVGNVLSHYFLCQHDILDKYEEDRQVINQDIVDFYPSKKYDLIVSISTLEHVGWDESPKNPRKILSAFQNLKKILAPGGQMVVTMPIGYNPKLNKLLDKGDIQFTEKYYFKKQFNNEWKEVKWQGVCDAKYNFYLNSANAIVIGIFRKI